MELKLGKSFSIRLGDKPQKTEVGATGSSVFAGLLYENEYNADLHGDRGLKIYDKMRRSDGQVKAGLLACKLPLMVAHWDIIPASKDPVDIKIAETVKADLFDGMTITWDDFLWQALLKFDFGHMVFEKVWELRDGRWTWRKLAPRLPMSLVEWHVAQDGGLEYIVQQAYIGTAFKRVEIPVEKLLVFTHEKEGSDYRGISLLRAAYKHWYYKNNLYAIDGIAAERHGVGLGSFTLPDTATADMKNAVKEMGERLHAHERAYIALPESIKFNLLGVQGQLHDIKGSIDHHDLQIVRSILAQFMNLGAKSTGSYALSQDQSQFFLMALESSGRNICNTMNRHGIRQMVDLNWDVKAYPKMTVSGLENPDVLAYATAISNLVTAQAITVDAPTENELRRMLKLPPKTAATETQPRPPQRPTDGRPQPPAQPPLPAKREWPVTAVDVTGAVAYRPDQARDEGGKFEEEGKGNGGGKYSFATKPAKEHAAPKGLLAHGERQSGLELGHSEGGMWTTNNVDHASGFGDVQYVEMPDKVVPGFRDPVTEANYHKRADARIEGVDEMETKDWNNIRGYWKDKGYDAINFGPMHRDDADDIWIFDRPKTVKLSEIMKATEFWRKPTGVENSVAFADIKDRLDSFEDRFVKAVEPIQKRQIKTLVSTMVGYIEDGEYERMAEIDVPFRDRVATAIQSLLKEMLEYGADQVKTEAERQGATVKLQEGKQPPDPSAFIRVRSLAIANILANKLRASLAWEALRQLREGTLDEGRLSASMMDLSDRELRNMAGLSAGEALNLGRQEQADAMAGVKRVTSSALLDDNTCGYCRGMDGKSWAPGEELANEPPYEDCDGRDKCRCLWVYTFMQEV